MLKKAIFALAIIFASVSSVQAEIESAEAETFMANMGEEVIALLTNSSISDKERAEQFKVILDQNFDVKAIGKFVLGRYWKPADEEEQKKFLELFTATTVASYATRFKDYTSEKFEITGSRQEKDGGVTVLSRILRENGQVIPIDWKIFKKNGKLQVYDVILEGISMGITQRSEYASIIQRGGGKLSALNQALQKKLVSYQQ